MSWLLVFAGFAALIVLHEAGHFAAAKAVGMRVERFALFFPPLIASVRRGETEYGIGAIPLGGYVRISGMNPNEPLPPEVAPRAYFRQAPWKRIVVILAGPAVNLLIAFLVLWAIFLGRGIVTGSTTRVQTVGSGTAASGVLHAGDRILSVDGAGGSAREIRRAIGAHRCAGAQRAGCRARTPARVVVLRDGRRLAFDVRPRYDARARRPLLGFSFAPAFTPQGPLASARLAVTGMWNITRETVSAIGRIFVSAQARKQVNGVVGAYETTRETLNTFGAVDALEILAIVSLSLAVINLFPFLPLDGGHVFWALAEKLRGRPIPFSVMERAGVVGFVLVAMLFLIGLTNDIDRLRGQGFGIR